MKKLFLFAALIMTGFAFYSCEDVVDNPAQDPAQSWNYSVSVKFADFDFSAQPNDPVTGEPNAYVAPTTLYVLNEQNTLMGTITTDAAPAAGDYGTYAGTITGSIGNNLTITTKIGNDLDKQDGTLASAIKNGIVQAAEVPIKIYNANSGTLTTAAAKLENNTAIAHTASGQIKGGDKIAVVADDQAFEWTVSEEFDPSKSADLYIAIPTNTNPEAEYTISSDSKDGYSRGASFKLADWPALVTGKVSTWIGWLPLIETGVDLTKWDAYMRTDPNSWYMNNINNGYTNTFDWRIQDGKSFIFTQSGEVLDSLNIMVGSAPNTEVSVTFNNVRLGKGRTLSLGNTNWWSEWDGTYDYYGYSGKVNVNLVGENSFETLSLHCPNTVKGEGSWKFNNLEVGNYGHSSSQNWNFVKEGASTFTIDKNMKLDYINVDGGILNIADGAELGITRENGNCINILNEGKLNIGKANVNLITGNGGNGFRVAEDKSELNIGAGAVVKVTTGNTGRALYAQSAAAVKIGEGANVYLETAKNGYSAYISDATLTMEKNAHLFANSDINKAIGYGLYLYYNSKLDLKEGATIETKGYEYPAIYVNTNSGTDDGATISIAENASITANSYGTGANASNKAYGMNLNSGKLAINGKGTFDVTSEEVAAIYARGNLTLDGASIIANGGTESPAIQQFNTLSITDKIISVKAKAGTGAKYIADGNDDEAKLENLVADKTKFNDTTADGVRTITPKPAAE